MRGFVLSEREPVGGPAAEQGKDCAAHLIVEEVILIIDIGCNDLEDEARETLPDVEEGEWCVVVVKFET